MSWIPTRADRVATEHIQIWLAEGLTASLMIEAVTGIQTSGRTLDDAHHAIAAAYDGLCGVIEFKRAG